MKCNYRRGKVIKYNNPNKPSVSKKASRKNRFLESARNICKSMGIPEYNPEVHGKSFRKYVTKYLHHKIDEEYANKKAKKNK